MVISKEDRDSYNAGKEDKEFIEENPIDYLISGAPNGRPSDDSKSSAYDKGLSGKQLDSDKRSSDSNGSDGGCYLTTACIRTMNLPDNCLELTVLRNFRDNILIPNARSKQAVREYYRIAPEIVQAVNEQDNSEKIWQSVYFDIKKAVSLVLNNDFEQAFKHYQQMTLGLKEKFLV